MRAVVVESFAPFDQARVQSLDDPVPASGQVVVAVAAVEVNYPDILVMEGSYQFKPPLPFVPGKAAAGTVCAVADDVQHVQVGDRVAVQVEYGAYAEKMLADACNCYPIPSSVSFDDAAALGLVYQTAHFALVERAALQPGNTVLVLGASGGIGVASIQLARALGAGCVIGGVLGADNAAVATQAGAHHTIELGDENLRDSLRDQTNRLTDGHGIDIVIDPVGGIANAASLRTMAWCGRMVIIGFASGLIPSIKANYLLVKNISVAGLQWSDYRERSPQVVAQVQAEIFDHCDKGRLQPVICERVPLHRFADALTLLNQGKAQGKVILTVNNGTN